MTCEEFEELLGVYALGALPPEELAEAERHLRTCERHPEALELLQAASSLATTAPEMTPPPALKARLMDTVRAEAAAEQSALRPETTQHAGFLESRTGYALAAGLAVVVAALLVWNVVLQTSGDDSSGQVVVELSGEAPGRVIYLEDQGLALMEVEGLEPLPSDEVYQVWAISGDQPASIGFLDVNEAGEARTAMRVDLAGVDVIAVTVEPAPGVEQPTSDPIITGEV